MSRLFDTYFVLNAKHIGDHPSYYILILNSNNFKLMNFKIVNFPHSKGKYSDLSDPVTSDLCNVISILLFT